MNAQEAFNNGIMTAEALKKAEQQRYRQFAENIEETSKPFLDKIQEAADNGCLSLNINLYYNTSYQPEELETVGRYLRKLGYSVSFKIFVGTFYQNMRISWDKRPWYKKIIKGSRCHYTTV